MELLDSLVSLWVFLGALGWSSSSLYAVQLELLGALVSLWVFLGALGLHLRGLGGAFGDLGALVSLGRLLGALWVVLEAGGDGMMGGGVRGMGWRWVGGWVGRWKEATRDASPDGGGPRCESQVTGSDRSSASLVDRFILAPDGLWEEGLGGGWCGIGPEPRPADL